MKVRTRTTLVPGRDRRRHVLRRSVGVHRGVKFRRYGERPRVGVRSVAAPALCSSVAGLDRLVVGASTRSAKDQFRFAFPEVVTVTDVDSGSPGRPGALHTPEDAGPACTARSTGASPTSSRSSRRPHVPARVTPTRRIGQGVTGLGGTGWIARSPQFWGDPRPRRWGSPIPDRRFSPAAASHGRTAVRAARHHPNAALDSRMSRTVRASVLRARPRA